MSFYAIAALALIFLVIFDMPGRNPLENSFRFLHSVLSLRFRMLHGKRIVVIDGDTIRFRKSRWFGLLGSDVVKGRLRGIDAPESSQKQGPASATHLRHILVTGGWHLAIFCKQDIYERDLIWMIGLKGPVGLRMLWRGQAVATTIFGAPIALMARILRRGMWGSGKVVDPRIWRMMNDHGMSR